MKANNNDETIMITAPKWVSVTSQQTVTGRRKTLILVAGLTRREFDALPGRSSILRLPDSPVRWKKHVTAHLEVLTDEPPSASGVTK